eukprot:Skav219409  [mRNA]  locus=scaffold377:10889:15320:- [translate_table: standard]
MTPRTPGLVSMALTGLLLFVQRTICRLATLWRSEEEKSWLPGGLPNDISSCKFVASVEAWKSKMPFYLTLCMDASCIPRLSCTLRRVQYTAPVVSDSAFDLCARHSRQQDMSFASLVIRALAWVVCVPRSVLQRLWVNVDHEFMGDKARQNLVNPNGESYPVGLYSCGWAASEASHYLAATLIKEVLGYNTHINEERGSGTVAGYYGITGCRTPNNAADRGCMQGVSYYHVHMEAWDGYRSDMAHIRKTYASMAPINKGSMGYKGVTTMYVPASIQAQAYSTAGKALEFYRAWNASWNRPSDYFNTISSVDQKNLMPCSKSALSDDAAMQRHVKHTGDADGVVIDTDATWLICLDLQHEACEKSVAMWFNHWAIRRLRELCHNDDPLPTGSCLRTSKAAFNCLVIVLCSECLRWHRANTPDDAMMAFGGDQTGLQFEAYTSCGCVKKRCTTHTLAHSNRHTDTHHLMLQTPPFCGSALYVPCLVF